MKPTVIEYNPVFNGRGVTRQVRRFAVFPVRVSIFPDLTGKRTSWIWLRTYYAHYAKQDGRWVLEKRSYNPEDRSVRELWRVPSDFEMGKLLGYESGYWKGYWESYERSKRNLTK